MINLDDLKRAAHETTDENGQPVVQIPREVWDKLLEKEVRLAKNERIRQALADWDVVAAELSDEWWDEFQDFLKHNRLKL